MSKFDPSKLGGAGMDTLDEVRRMPLLRIIQSNSPEVKKSHPQYATRHIEGAEEGMIVLSSTGDLFSEAEILPLAIKTLYAEWRPKNSGGGFIAHHDHSIVTHPDYKKGSAKSEYDEFLGDNELLFTMYIFVRVRIEDKWENAVMALKKTELKHGRTMQDMIKKFRYPEDHEFSGKTDPFMFSRTFTLSSKAESNDAGDWYNWSVEPARTLDGSDGDLLNETMELQQAAIADLPAPQEVKQLETAGVSDGDPF